VIEFTTKMKWSPEWLAYRLYWLLIGTEPVGFKPHADASGEWTIDATGKWLLTVDNADEKQTRATLRHRDPLSVSDAEWNALRRMIAWRLGTVESSPAHVKG
jgi:hypothetical protein